VIGEERKDGSTFLGSTSIGHIPDVLLKLVMGINDEVVISTPEKNRDTDDRTSRCFFKRTKEGLVELPESETGFLPRHLDKNIISRVSYVARTGNEYTVEEITAVFSCQGTETPSIRILGMSSAKSKGLQALVESICMLIGTDIMVRANNTEKLKSDSELACVLVIISLLLNLPLPVDSVFIGGVDNLGYILPVDGMEQRVKRAKGLGYQRFIGPKAMGSQNAIWEEYSTLESVMKAFFK